MNPELAAQTILQHFWHRHLPVRPIDIASKLGISVFETDDQKLIGYDREAKRIVIDKGLAQNLRRFNIAYHMGRYVLDLGDMTRDFKRKDLQANLFAIELLIPKEALRVLVEDRKLRFNQLCKEFDVPRQALMIRLSQHNFVL